MRPSASSPAPNAALSGFRCLRCERDHGVEDLWHGCPHCAAEGRPASVVARYAALPTVIANGGAGMARYGDWLPYRAFPTLGEGNTPVLPVDLGVGDANFWLKQECQNPTGSHKDRMSALAIARAKAVGARLVIAASSGNAGLSVAAYAAAAGLACEIVATADCNIGYRRAMAMTGADIVATRDPVDRWHYVRRRIQQDGVFPITNFHIPPVGSNPFGVEGFKTIAYELFEQLGRVPDAVIVPSSRGDLLFGIHRGFVDLRASGLGDRLPRLFAVEPFARLAKVMAGDDVRAEFPGDTRQLSIAGNTATYQARVALRDSAGGAVVVGDADAEQAQAWLATRGPYLELSSAAAIAAARQLAARGELAAMRDVVMIGTATGARDPIIGDFPLRFVA